jgi:hypothetical protein
MGPPKKKFTHGEGAQAERKFAKTGFTAPMAIHRNNFTPVRAESGPDFILSKLKVDASQLVDFAVNILGT